MGIKSSLDDVKGYRNITLVSNCDNVETPKVMSKIIGISHWYQIEINVSTQSDVKD